MNEQTRPWWEVLACAQDASLEEQKAAYQARALEVHPDRGGSRDAWDELNRAFEQAAAS